VRDFEVFDAYWGERAALILDDSLQWRASAWADQNDHDHCSICWARIDSAEKTSHFAAAATLRICSGCYSSYVRPRSVDFRELGGPAA
jgi:hypothetical protein